MHDDLAGRLVGHVATASIGKLTTSYSGTSVFLIDVPGELDREAAAALGDRSGLLRGAK